MIDVTFLLLVFFVCTIRFKTLEGKLSAYLPEDVGGNPEQVDPVDAVDVVVAVVEAGVRKNLRDEGVWHAGDAGNPRFRWVGREVEFRVGPLRFTEVDALRRRLAELHRADPGRPVTIDARAGTVTADVVTALDAAVAARFEEIRFAAPRAR